MRKISKAIFSIGTIAGIAAMIGFFNTENLWMFILSSLLATLNLVFAVSEANE